MTPKEERFKSTLTFLEKSLSKGSKILDLGVANELGEEMKKLGYVVTNTKGEDLDRDQDALKIEYDAVTAFEILEHTLNPFGILSSIESPRLFASVPLRLWFAPAYRSKSDLLDRHFHEFEDWQFDWLLEKAGWKIVRSEKWKSPTKKIGLRPILRRFTDRYYIVEAIKINKDL